MRVIGSAGPLSTIAVVALLLASSAGCSTENTCFAGNAMTNPRIIGKALPSLQGSRLRIGWDPGTESAAQLPRNYFTAGKVNTSKRSVGPDGPSMEEKVESEAEREIAVTIRGTAAELQGKLRFEIDFPDRKQFLSCERSDEAVDKYGLSVEAELDGNGTVTKSTVTEIRVSQE